MDTAAVLCAQQKIGKAPLHDPHDRYKLGVTTGNGLRIV
jgi:hypothetical protein